MIKLLHTLTFISLSAAAMAATPQDVKLFGQLYSGGSDNSVYSFSSGSAAGMEKVAEISAVPNCGSVKTADRFYCFSEEAGDYGSEYYVYVYDTTDNYRLVTAIGSAYSIAKPQQVLACDPTTGKIYSVFAESSYYGTEYYLGEVNISNRSMTKIGSSLYFGYGSTSIVAMAFNPEGELYAIASNAYLYKIDKTNANMTNVGYIGIYPEYVQSMTFSPDGSTIFWAACNNEIAALYSVNPDDGSAQKIKDFSNGEEFVSLWAGDVEAADGAPGVPSGLNAEFAGGSLSGEITFTAPVVTHAGGELIGEISYEVTVDRVVIGSGTVQPGNVASCDVTVPEAGMYEFKVTLFNGEGQGDSATLPAMYVGNDVPRYVENLKLTRGDSDDSFIVTWDAPLAGAHGGYVDLSTVKYRVRRLPDLDVLSENAVSPFLDTFTSDEPVKCSYEVMPYIDENIKGLPLTTNSLMIGRPFEVPYNEDFESTKSASTWTVVDANGDGHSWEYLWDFGYFRVYDNENVKDDWLISPYIRLEQECSYTLSFKVRTIATEKLEVKMGAGLSPEELTDELLEAETIPDTDNDWVERKVTFKCESDANIHFGFHAVTDEPADGLALYIDDVKLEKADSSGIGEAASFEAEDLFVIEAGGVRALVPTGLDVYASDGRLLHRASLAAGETLHLPSGMYIISVPGTPGRKTFVK